MHMYMGDDEDGTYVTVKDRKAALNDFLNSYMSHLDYNGQGIFTYFDSQFLVLLEEEADKLIQDILQEDIRVPRILAEQLYDPSDRAELLAIDATENVEGNFLIFRVT